MLAGSAEQTQLYDSPTFMYSMEVGKYSLVSRSMGTNAVYLLRMLQALLVWIAYSWYLRPDPKRSDQHHQHLTPMLKSTSVHFIVYIFIVLRVQFQRLNS